MSVSAEDGLLPAGGSRAWHKRVLFCLLLVFSSSGGGLWG